MGLQLDPQRTRFAAFTIALVAFTIILFLTAPLIWSVLQIFIIAGLLALALDPLVHWQVQRRVPRWAATIDLLLLVVLVVSLTLYFLVPPLVRQFQQFIADAPTLWEQISRQAGTTLHRFPTVEQALRLDRFVSEALRGAGAWVAAAQTIFASAVGAFTAVILIFVTAFYTLLNPWPLLYGIRGLFPQEWWPTIDRITSESARRIRSWVLAVIVLGIVIGLMDYLALALINFFFDPDIPFILFFAILGGLLEVVPVIGPIIAAILPSLVAFAIHPVLGLLVLGSYFIIQQLENNFIAPLILHKAVQIHQVSLIFALVVLSGIFGVFGAIIAVPVASVIKVLYDEWYYPLAHHGHHPEPAPVEEGTEET